MLARIWHGFTTPDNAEAYEGLLKDKVFPYIESKSIAGYRGIELLKRARESKGPNEEEAFFESEVEFITIMWFDTLEDIIAFAGQDYDAAVVLPEARALLKRFDPRSRRYTISSSTR